MQRDLYELRHKETLRVIKALADEVEFLRAKHFGSGIVSPPAVSIKSMPEPDFMPDPTRSPFYISEEEEDLAALKDGGFIDATEYSQALRQLRAAAGVPISVEQS